MQVQLQAFNLLKKESNDFNRSNLAHQIKWSGSLFIVNVQI